MDGMAGRNVLWSVTVLGMLAAAAEQTADGRREYDAMCESLRTFNEVQAEAGLPEFNVPTRAEWAALQAFPGAPTAALAEAVEPPPPPLHHLAIQPASNGTVNLQLNWPSNLTDRLELFAATDLVGRDWRIVQSNILTALSTDAVWSDSTTGHAARFYAAGSAELDSDSDRIPNLRERLLHGTDPLRFDTDGDQVGDRDEIESGTDPANPSNYWIEVSGTIDRSFPASPFPSVTIPPYEGALRFELYHYQIDYSEYPKINIWSEFLAASSVNSNDTFHIERTTVNRPERIAPLLIFSDDNYSRQYFSGFSGEWPHNGRFGGGTLEINFVLSSFIDPDGLSSVWRVNHALGLDAGYAGHLDPDEDRLINLHEYWLQSDPNDAADPVGNYALADAAHAVNSRIAGRNATEAKPLFSVQDHVNARYVRNTNCWAADIDLTCASPWNNAGGGRPGNQRAGTLISPRHLLFAAHLSDVPPGSVLRFVDRNNQVVERALVARKEHPDYQRNIARRRGNFPDLTVGLLNADVPTNRIAFAKVLPDNYRDYIASGEHLPALALDQEEKALVVTLQLIHEAINDGRHSTLNHNTRGGNRSRFSEDLIPGDSGNPQFLLLNGEPVLLTVLAGAGAGSGTSVTALKGDLNWMMSDLDVANGVTNRYQLTEIDLSGFDRLIE